MPLRCIHSLTLSASKLDSGRNLWSTVNAVICPPQVSAQTLISKTRAMLSDPPDKATARWGVGSKGANAAIEESKARNKAVSSIEAVTGSTT